jgi:hypothetical protein
MLFLLITSLVLSVVAFPALVAGNASYHGRIITRSSDLAASYDFIVVGGGTSGLVVASRLTEDESKPIAMRIK